MFTAYSARGFIGFGVYIYKVNFGICFGNCEGWWPHCSVIGVGMRNR